MTFPRVGGEFQGAFNDAGDVVTGTWTQLGNSNPLELRRVDQAPTRQHIESWQGTLKVASREFEFQMRIFRDDKGQRSAVLDSFSEMIEALPLDLTESGDGFEFFVPASHAKFVGKRSDDGARLIGQWQQGGGKFPLEFHQIPLEQTRSLSYRRPQTPQPPFDYAQLDLTIPVADGRYAIAGTLTHPHGAGPFPVVVLISGSGPQDRDETIFGHKPFLVIADHLTKLGIAVFRYDERGVGKSTGVFAEATSRDFANDVADISRYLAHHDLIDGNRIGLVGHSEGGMIAPMVAAERPQFAAIVMLAGPGVPGRQIVLNQSRTIAKAAGFNDDVLDQQEEMLRRWLSGDVDFGDRYAKAMSATMSMLRLGRSDEAKQQIEEAERRIKESISSAMTQIQSPWFQYFLDYDPAPALARLKMPVLVMIGDKDLQVDADLNLPVIEAQLKRAGNRDVTIRRFENLNHLFQTCQTGEPSEYAAIEETFAPEALECLAEWLTMRLLNRQ